MTKTERWVWLGVCVATVIAGVAAAATGTGQPIMVFVPLAVGFILWCALGWIDRCAAERERRRNG